MANQRSGVIGWVVLAVVLALIGWQPGESTAELSRLGLGDSSGLVTHVEQREGKSTRVILIDPRQQALMVYDIGRDDGKIELRSIRNFSGDVQMQEHNTGKPTPLEIRKQLQRQ